MGVIRRRFYKVQYIFFVALFVSSIYLLSGKNEKLNVNEPVEELTANFIPHHEIPQQEIDDDVKKPMNVSVTRKKQTKPGIQPFPKFQPKINPDDDNRTLQWLDLWNDDANCTRYQVRLMEMGSHAEPGALVSFPGSGNSWLRMLLMGLTGIFVHSVYAGEDTTFQSKAGSRYELGVDCGCTLLQKTHDFTLDAALYHLPVANRTHSLDDYKRKGILIIRNPYSAIRSYRNFRFGGMQGKAAESAFQGPIWDGFVSRSVAGWETLATVWIRGLENGGVIYYERLRHNTRPELIRLANLMGVTYDEDRLDCVLKHAEDNSFKRDSRNSTKIDPYTASQRLLIHKAIEKVQKVLKDRGLDPLPVEYYDRYQAIPEEYGIPLS